MSPGSFLSYNVGTKVITFSPTSSSDIGTHTVSVKVSDGMDSPTYTFTVTVPSIPYFTTALVTQTVKLGGSLNYPLPSIINPDTGSSAGATVSYTTT